MALWNLQWGTKAAKEMKKLILGRNCAGYITFSITKLLSLMILFR